MSDDTANALGSSGRQSHRQQALQRALDYYSGRSRPPLQRRMGEPDDNLLISLGRLIVDKGSAFLFGKEVHSQVTGTGVELKQDWLNECWRRNKRGITLLKLSTNGGIFGHAFVRLIDTGGLFPRIVVLDPQTVEVLTDPSDVDSVWKVTITPPATDSINPAEPAIKTRTVIQNPNGAAGHDVRAPNAAQNWAIIDQQMSAGGVWQDVNSAPWPYPFCPVVHCQNLPKPNDFWGEADLPEDVITLLDGINRVASHYQKIIRLHAHPKVWTRGMGSAHLDVGIDSVIHLPSETAELKALEMQSDLTSTMALLEKLLSLLSYMVRIPMVAMGEPDQLGSISGVALQIRFQPLIEKTEAKRLTYGDLLTEVDRCLLSMGGFGDQTLTDQTWPALLPSDQLAERQTWVLDESLGLVSKETLSQLAGYEFDTEQKRITEEKAAAIAAGLEPDPAVLMVPPPAAIGAPMPDIAKHAKSA